MWASGRANERTHWGAEGGAGGRHLLTAALETTDLEPATRALAMRRSGCTAPPPGIEPGTTPARLVGGPPAGERRAGGLSCQGAGAANPQALKRTSLLELRARVGFNAVET